MAADVLLRLALFTGDAGYEHAGVSALRLVRDAMAGAPTGFGQALCALDLYVGPSNEVAIIGDPSSDGTRALVAEVTGEVYRPNVVWPSPRPATSAPRWRSRSCGTATRRTATPTAYVCERFACKLPVTDAARFALHSTV